MFLRVTRRNLLLLLLTLSVFGLLIYSQIGSRVSLGKGAAHSTGRKQLEHISSKDEVAGGWSRQRLGEEDEEGPNNDVIPVIRFPHESANEDEEVDDDDDEALDVGSLMKDGSDSAGKAKAAVLIGNHMRVGGNIEKLMREEGLIRGAGIVGKIRKGTSRQGQVRQPEQENGEKPAAVILQKPLPVKMSVRASTGNVTKTLSGDTNTQVMVINEHARSKGSKKGTKIGWSRNRQSQPNTSNVSNRTSVQNFAAPVVAVVANNKSAPTHYFYETPGDIKAKKLYIKCLSKLSQTERKALASFEESFSQKESLMVDGVLTLGGKWVILSEFMRSLDREQRLPQVINIGAKKSGTTAFGWFLNMHPQISHSFGNEVHFFDKNYYKGLQYYKSRMNFAKRNQLVFEKTPRYLVTDSAPEHAFKDLPSDVKFIICIRDPLKRALSDFRHDSTLGVRRAYKKNHDVIKGRTAETEGARFAAKAFDKSGNVNSSFDSVRTSSYVKHFRNWLSYFPLDRFIIVDHQQLVDDAFHELHRVERFLGLTPFFERNMFYYDKRRRGTCVYRSTNACPPRSSPGYLPAGRLTGPQEQKLRDYFRPLNRELVELVGDHNFTWVDL